MELPVPASPNVQGLGVIAPLYVKHSEYQLMIRVKLHVTLPYTLGLFIFLVEELSRFYTYFGTVVHL